MVEQPLGDKAMQDQYAGDICDYAKLSLLRVFCGEGLSIGVNWFYVDPTEVDGKIKDNRMVDYLEESATYRPCDSELFDKLKKRHTEEPESGRMSLTDIQKIAESVMGGISCFDHQLSFAGTSKLKDRVAVREKWFQTSRDALVDRDLVFLDPDNGLEAASVGRGNKKSLKYALYQEIAAHLLRGQYVLVTQFRKLKTEYEEWREILSMMVDRASTWTIKKPRIIEFEKGQKIVFLLFQPPTTSGTNSKKLDRAILALPSQMFSEAKECQ